MTKLLSRLSRRACLLALPVMLASFSAQAQDKLIKFIVSAPAGGVSDMVARSLGESIQKQTGQTVLVDNRPGGGGVIAVDAFLAAPRDGRTFLVTSNSLVTEVPHTVRFRIDPLKDLVPLAEAAVMGMVLVTNPQLPVRNVPEMISYVKAHPNKISYASFTTGTNSHIMGLQLNQAAGLDMKHVGYKGAPPAEQDLMGGHVHFMFDSMGTALPLIKAGKLRALAVGSTQRSSFLPDVPTFAELGYGELSQIGTAGVSVLSTPDVPADTRAKVREMLLKAIVTPEMMTKFTAIGIEVGSPTQTVDEVWNRFKRLHALNGQVLRSVNYTPN